MEMLAPTECQQLHSKVLVCECQWELTNSNANNTQSEGMAAWLTASSSLGHPAVADAAADALTFVPLKSENLAWARLALSIDWLTV